MIHSNGLLNIPTDRKQFLNMIVEKLGVYPSDFQGIYKRVISSGNLDQRRLAAGVLLPLVFRESSSHGRSESGSFYFLLIKRSSTVAQPGDLGCPGGMLHPILDRFIRTALVYGHFPTFSGDARKYALQRQSKNFRLINLFWANTLRESWEEIRLSPFCVRFLGPLPTYNLLLFRRTIFPAAGFVESTADLKPNSEVERLVHIPLSSFFKKELFGTYQIKIVDPSGNKMIRNRPCLYHRDPEGREEILWGATFYIIIRFLKIVLNYRMPDWRHGRVVIRNPDYPSGRYIPEVFPQTS